MGVDLITQLPCSRGFDSIAVYVDHYSDQAHLVPCHTTITAEGTADLHYKDIFHLHGVPRKIHSDRGPQFAAHFMCALYGCLGIETGLTTAYHPQSNGKVEHKNQQVEEYLRMFCHHQQDDWVDHLPAAEFALNSRTHRGTGYSPFELIYGYKPDFHISVSCRTNIPLLEERLDKLEKARSDAAAALQLSKEKMKEAYERGKKTAHVFKVGDMVRLAAKDIKLKQPSPKLGPCQLGPFKVLERVGELGYHLELPDWLHIHPVLHVDRLSPWQDNGVAQAPPPPLVVEGEEEYEVDRILDSKYAGRGLRYLVAWKGYGPEHNSWEPASNLRNSLDIVAEFHTTHPDAPRQLNAAMLADSLPMHTIFCS